MTPPENSQLRSLVQKSGLLPPYSDPAKIKLAVRRLPEFCTQIARGRGGAHVRADDWPITEIAAIKFASSRAWHRGDDFWTWTAIMSFSTPLMMALTIPVIEWWISFENHSLGRTAFSANPPADTRQMIRADFVGFERRLSALIQKFDKRELI
jgi:hypothetical protein